MRVNKLNLFIKMITTTGDHAYIALEQRIFGNRQNNLSTAEIHDIVKLTPDSILNLFLYRGFLSQAISPDITIVQLLGQTRKPAYLLPIAMCLRAHADPNMYVRVPRLGVVHILAYIYFTLSDLDSRLLDTIIVMFVAKGSKPDLPVYDSRVVDAQGQVPAAITVKEWITISGYNNIFTRIRYSTFPELSQSIDPDSLHMISIVLDMPVLTSRAYTPKDMSLALKALIPLENIPPSNQREGLDYLNLNEAVTALYSQGFEYLLQKGQFPSYLLINRLLMLAQKFRQELYLIPAQECEDMLISAVNVGTSLDGQQLQMLSVLGENTYQRVLKDYNIPTWRKVCRLPPMQPALPLLQKLAISLNLDPNLPSNLICQQLNELAQADANTLIEANRKRQEMRVTADVSSPSYFMTNSLPNVVCRNANLLPHNPYDYTDLHLAYYRDDMEAVWCFSSDMFSNLISTQINPYSKQRLPNSFVELVKYKMIVLQQYNLQNNKVQTFAQALANLKSTEQVDTSGQVVQDFINLAGQYGVTENTIRQLTTEQMMAALRTINFPINLSPLSQESALISTAYIVMFYDKSDRDLFFRSIRR